MSQMEGIINHLETLEKSPKKRVLFIITQSEMGGAQRFLLNLTSRLNPDKYEILIAVGSDGNGEFLKSLSIEKINHVALPNLKRDISPWHDFRAILEIKKLIKKFQPDTLFLNSSKAGFLGSLAATFSPQPKTNNQKLTTIYRIGGWSFNDPWPKWKKVLWVFLEKLSAGWKDCIILNNRHDFDQAKKLKIKPRKSLELIYNGIDLKKMEFLESDRAKLEMLKKISARGGNVFQAEYIIGTVANFYKPKGLEYLIEAIKFLSEETSAILIIVGDGREREYLESLIVKNDLRSKIFMIGALNDASQYLKAFDVFVLPSVKEGFPWSLLEAMAAKLPIVATSVGAVPEIIESGKNGLLIAPKNPKAIADSITTILSNDKLRQELGIQAHQTVLFKFSLEKMVREIEALL
ncbi:MAG: glycosyltransferase family 4 protein [Candidatus Yanofskybacteria bacterium]|nr:glycosyltransferase family 4 protein [Candidatus Yanofskybacteria bacterium]